MASQPLLIRIQGDPSAFKAAMDEVRTAVDRSGASIQSISTKTASFGESLGRLGSTLTLGVTAPIVGMATAAVKAAVDLDALQRGLSATMKSSTAAADEMKKLREVARLPGLGLEEAVQGSIRLQTLGVSADKSRKIMAEFGNALSIAGGSKADFGEAIRQLSQLAAVGKVTKENLDPIIERIPAVAAIIKEKFGPEALGDPAKVFKQLGIDSAQFIDIITQELGKLERSTGGPKAALENLTDTIKESAARIGDKLLPAVTAAIPKIEALVGGAADAVDTFLKLPEPIKNTAIALTALAVAAGPVASGIAAVTGALRSLAAFGGVAGGATAGLFGAAVVVSIGQTMTAIDQLRDRYRALAEDRQLAMTGAKSPTGFGPARDSIVGMKVDVKALAEELDLFGTKANKAADASKALGAASGEASNKIRVTNVALRDANGELDKHSLAYVELQERVKSGLGRVKDAMLDYVRSGTVFGKQLEMHRDPMQAMARATELYRLELEALVNPLQQLSAISLKDAMHTKSPGALTPLPTTLGNAPLSRNDRIDLIQQNSKAAEKALRQVSTVITDLSRGIARSIIEWKGWGEMVKGVAKNAAEAIIRSLVEGALTKLASKILDVGGLFGKVFGGGTGAIMSATSGGASAAGGAVSSGASGVASGVGAGLTGIVGAVGSVVSAVSGIISNFQLARQEGTLNAIEKEVRYSQIHLLNLLHKANEYWPYSKTMWESLIRMEQRAGMGGAVYNFNFAGATFGAGMNTASAEVIFRTAIDKMKLQGLV